MLRKRSQLHSVTNDPVLQKNLLDKNAIIIEKEKFSNIMNNDVFAEIL